MKALVFLLVLGNLLFLAFAGGYFGAPDNPDAGRVGQQLVPERVRVVGYDQTPPARAEVEKLVAEAPPPVVPEELCLVWEHLPADEADRLASTLAEKLAGIRVERRAVPVEGAGWWVMVPPLANKTEADKKVGELKELGINDLFVVREAGSYQFAISLGVFSTEKGGQEHLGRLKAKGVKSAKLIRRPGKETQFAVEARGPLAKKAEVEELAAGVVEKSPAQVCQ
ncbi:MAG: SPOR domain-containing protein [Azonexus sp.]